MSEILWNRLTDRVEQYDSKEKCFKWLHKVDTFAQYFKDWRKIKRRVYQNLDDLQNLLTKLTVKIRSEKEWLLYEFLIQVTNQMMHRYELFIKSYSSLGATHTHLVPLPPKCLICEKPMFTTSNIKLAYKM